MVKMVNPPESPAPIAAEMTMLQHVIMTELQKRLSSIRHGIVTIPSLESHFPVIEAA